MIEIFSNLDIHFVYLFIFTLGLSFGTGAALLGNILFYTATEDRKITKDEFAMIRRARQAALFGLLLYAFAGIGLFTLAYESMLGLEIFYASMVVAAILTVNALVFHYRHLPELERQIAAFDEKGIVSYSPFVLLSEVVSIVSWIFLNLYHSMHRSDVGFWFFIAMYVFTLFAATCATRFLFRKRLDGNGLKVMRAFGMGFLLLSIIAAALASPATGQRSSDEEKEHTHKQNKVTQEESTGTALPVYTFDEVRQHNTIEDCWVVIDDMVFDAQAAAKRYPEIYTCGSDVTKAYRTVVPEGVSKRMMKYQIGYIGYTRDEVAQHNKNKEDCWLIIDEFVFDATKESKLHPAAFGCGGDATENYHKNHGEGISNKMMRYKIGRVAEAQKEAAAEISSGVNDNTSLTPVRELYVDEGSWDTRELMAVVEKDAENVLFIDGKTHKKIGRVRNVGYQPHTSVFTPDGKYMYIIARNGWLTKIDLATLKPQGSVRVGENSRGTALTDNGKYLAVGNYEPGNIVIVDPKTLQVLKVIPTVGEINGKEVESRVGGLVEKGDTFIAALKDLNSVWVIDTERKGFPVIEKHWNIGDNETPLHDAFLTPDGKFYIVASMGSDTVWVMDTETWKPVGEIKTGKTPHTGPGATWGNFVYVPALGEGLITVIDRTTWKPVKYIKTAGPGLFVRSFPENPDYPYVWAETAFGDYHDEVYVIDARTNEIAKTLRPVPGESSWHPEFTNDGKYVYVVSQTGNQIVVYDANTFEVVSRIDADTPSAVSNVGNRIEEIGL